MMAVFVIALSFLVAMPVWQTELQREKEEELIFRGQQYAEAVRLYVQKNPGRYPASLKELLDKKFLRRPFKDPFDREGQWNVILVSAQSGGTAQGMAGRQAAQEVLVAPEKVLPAIKNPRSSAWSARRRTSPSRSTTTRKATTSGCSFTGQDPKKPPKIRYYGEKD